MYYAAIVWLWHDCTARSIPSSVGDIWSSSSHSDQEWVVISHVAFRNLHATVHLDVNMYIVEHYAEAGNAIATLDDNILSDGITCVSIEYLVLITITYWFHSQYNAEIFKFFATNLSGLLAKKIRLCFFNFCDVLFCAHVPQLIKIVNTSFAMHGEKFSHHGVIQSAWTVVTCNVKVVWVMKESFLRYLRPEYLDSAINGSGRLNSLCLLTMYSAFAASALRFVCL